MVELNELTSKTMAELHRLGTDIAGFGDLTTLPHDVSSGLSVGISVALKYPKEVILGIAELPTQEYCDWYNKLNERLDSIVTLGAQWLQSQGYQAIPQTRAQVGTGQPDFSTILPHKTIATRAGIGWIGKSALLVTTKYGSMIRLASILTDAPLETAEPINKSQCGDCQICTQACPGEAILGKSWEVGLSRDELFDPTRCRDTALARSILGFGREMTICGKCIEVCPYTQRYLTNGTVIEKHK